MSKNIAVVAANGKGGQFIVTEAVRRGLDVTAVVRGENKTDAPHAIIKDLFDLTPDDLAGFDAVVDAFGTAPANADEHITSLKHLADILSGTDTRLLVVGGASSLYTNKEHTSQLSDTFPFPEEIKAVPLAKSAALEQLRQRSDVHWTYISPAVDFQVDGERRDTYTLGGEEYTTDENGVSAISYADYAIAIVDEIEADTEHTHDHQRISVRW